MATWAMCFGGVSGSNRIASEQVHSMRNQLQMIWVTARSITTKMIYLFIVGKLDPRPL